MASALRISILLVLLALSESRSDALSRLGRFWFVNPGITLTKDGPGLELSGGRTGLGSGEATLLGGLVRYEVPGHRAEIGMEAGLAIFLVEMGFSFSDRGAGEFIAPDLCIPIPGSGNVGAAVNLFFRVYPASGGENTFGASLKIAWMR